MNPIFSRYSVFFIFFTFFVFPLPGQINDSAVITFTGILLAESYDITTGNEDQSIRMGTYDTSELLNVGDVPPNQMFTINVQGCPITKNTICSSGVNANVRFTGDVGAINSALPRLSVSVDSATGLGIEILDNNGMAITINGESGFRDLVLNKNGDINLMFKFRYKLTQGNMHAGQANTLLYFNADY